ncbi:energy transducer TonB [Rosenbergiella epipactidis]|uniref:energy transducer TonB n=1 Tax=Rosenbergiella epipactidis TaxID=1544694 RepID=UPI001F4EBAF0|nr:energy transducer TonB [Rosenbergiella epipactidis]
MRFIIVLIFSLFSSFVFADNKITYPERAWQLHKSGDVDILYNIDERGYVDNIRVINEEPKGFFVRGIKNQMDNWRFPKGHPRKDINLSVKFRYPKSK